MVSGKKPRQGDSIAKLRLSLLTRAITFRTKRLIVILTPGYEHPCGGVISIATIYRESLALRHLHRSKVALCTVPGDPALTKYTWFENQNYILDLESVLRRCVGLDHLLIHIPEYAINQFMNWLNLASSTLMGKVKELHLNIMLQNIDLIHDQDVGGLMSFGRVTCTTAHEAYTNSKSRAALGVPVHMLGVYWGPELFSLSPYHEKEPLLIVSHDPHPLRERVLQQIAEAFPHLRIQAIHDISYEQYKDLARRAKWSLTFGEGLDSYFAYPVFSGGVSFAVFNERFFTNPFTELENVYPSWEVLMDTLTADLKRLDEPQAYNQCWGRTYDLLCRIYNTGRFRENLRMFYRGEYTFP